jgi:hypothetical protein
MLDKICLDSESLDGGGGLGIRAIQIPRPQCILIKIFL